MLSFSQIRSFYTTNARYDNATIVNDDFATVCNELHPNTDKIQLSLTTKVDFCLFLIMNKRDCLVSPDNEIEQPNVYSWITLDKQQPLSSCVSYLLDPNHRPYSYLISVTSSMISALMFFCIYFPAGMQSTIIKVMELDNTQYDMIFSAYSWPDIVMSILGTVMIDKYLGMRRGLCVFSCILLTGQCIICVGAYTNSFQTLLCGRILLGCSVGSLVSLITSFLTIWFKGKEVIFAMPLKRSLERLGAALALFTPQFLDDALADIIVSPHYRHGTTLMFGTLLCFIAVLCAVSVAYLDKRGAKIIGRKPIARKKHQHFGYSKFFDRVLDFDSNHFNFLWGCEMLYCKCTSVFCKQIRIQ